MKYGFMLTTLISVPYTYAVYDTHYTQTLTLGAYQAYKSAQKCVIGYEMISNISQWTSVHSVMVIIRRFRYKQM